MAFFSRFKQAATIEELLPVYESWFSGERGRLLLAKQQLLLDEMLTDCFGYHLLQLSVDSRLELYRDCRVQNKYRSHPTVNTLSTCAEFEHLPFANESLDVVVVHHVQEVSNNPHQLLRELHRVVIPHGHLIMIGFNPWSPLGSIKQFSRFLPQRVWHNQLISSPRMQDWLSLLGFETQQINYGQHFPAMLENTDKRWLNELLTQWPFGNFYIISALKEVSAMTPLKPKWKKARNEFVGLAPAKRQWPSQSATRK
ncbi:methyltransferase domain-containing protein [Oceanicoccus sp. KOV_DT_Chl]|uniref:methyltransferase domain-containing protein n=1 Tax=Oceanicoccus sp. KOV_DT_Chl TaxID=1904639 RepID=UPI0011AF0571|nr:methyltransferase domain-containing protein [Oceanicoccus sp. KOV_DT_Chl]